MFIDVIVELKAKTLDKTFTYKVPNNLINDIKIGKRVKVPFGKQKLEGFVLDIKNDLKVDYEIKDILEIIDEDPVLNEEMLELGKYISKKTMSTLISSYQTMLPAALKAHKDFVVNKKYDTYIELIDKSYEPKNDNQKEIIDLLKNNKVLKSEISKISISSLNTLLKREVIKEIKVETYRINNEISTSDKKVNLTSDQKNIIEKVKMNLNTFKPFLLHGVTGSGKTEVYLNIIEEVLKNGKEVIVLVPEISLTPQMVNIFRSRFKNSIAILHSALSDGEKYDEWRKIERKEVSIVIGARSAIFAPFTNLGLIILDEEHSDTYKQENNPKYDSIDIAIKRAKTFNCPVLLGSATPSIESYTRAKLGVYELLELTKRINNTVPDIKIVNMRDEIRKGNRIFSSELLDSIQDRLNKNEQVILFLNRRGYSTTITCKECGNVIKCPNCDIPLTYHKNGNKLNCHYCNYTTYKPKKCNSCGSEDISSYGLGTEKVEEEIKKIFKDAKTIRMDIDTTKRKGSHEKIIKDFKNKKYNILIGTQMISKGLDFEDVTLVGVLNGDMTLNIPDFRSAERTFDLLNQVAGRAGRVSKPGKVLIQCFNINHYSIVYAAKNDYKSFYKEEINIRKKLNYPPYCSICLIKIIGNEYNYLINEANKIKDYLIKNKNLIILGPSLSNLPKINNKYYVQIVLKYKHLSKVYNSINFVKNKYVKSTKMVIDIDFNPKKL